ncbi:dystonin isoform X4 [Pygocentrus nattereri]|uniref:dystonin isoform X4 n=1 Tax=Pygocentrus nattereri TaxID=42514 RepID=UPI0018917E67|nr:dystonin isoform X4 [Pygocentrus nattereri]
MIAAAFLVLLRPLSLQCVLLLLLLLLGTVATILFLCCWHRRLRHEKIPIKSVLARRSRSREAGLRSHHFRSEGFRHSPRHVRRSARVRVSQERPLMDIPESDPDSTAALRKRKVKKRVQPEFYHSVQVTPTRKPSSGSASLRCSMSSSADFSDDDDSSLKSGSVSPAPGDTLPWNLPRHERSKRKIQGGSVLDPAERAVLRIADERDRVQKKTFTKWINQHLLKVRKHVNDLYEDLRDGHNLISLLEVLSGDTLPRERDFLKTLRLVSAAEACAVERHGRVQDDDDDDEDKGPREKGRMRFHRLQNVQIALDYLKRRQVKLVNIRNDDITDGNPKLTLGLIWTIILHFQISDIHVTGESEDMTAKERLLLWSQQMTEGYVGVRCDNFTTSWRDGRLFNALIHKYRPDLVDMSKVSAQSTRSNLEHAFCVAEQLGVARLLDPEDVDVSSPDEKSVITYVSTLYDVFPKVPEGVEGINANDVDIKWVEYQNMVNYLSQWIKHNVSVMSDRNFPSNPVELKALYSQYLHFKESEIPLKENEKTKIKHLYKMLEVWIEFGRIQLPQGYHPNDVEKEWGKLIVAMLEREKSLRPEVDRLEMLQQIANRVHRDCVAGEDKLALARASLQSDAKRLESGIQFQNEAEVAGYLLECENLLRQQVVDIQILLDGKFYLADQLVQRVSKLRDDLLALRTECSSVYSKGRTLTSEQTKIMISGITQSLNSGFSQNLNPSLSPALTPALTPGALVTPGSTLSSSLTPVLTPAMTPALTPGLQPTLVGGGNVETGVLQHLKQMQIRKPMLKSSLVDPNLSEEEVNMKFVQDLLNWVEEMQVQLDRGEWGSDLPSVESHLENHRNVHKAIEDFQMSLKEAKISEIQMTQPLKQSYSEKLGNLENQYGRLLNCSRERQKHLDSLHDFVSHATEELIWLNEKEEEEVAFDWSERNSNVSRKKDYHAELMRELDKKEGMIKSVQDQADSLLQQNHPARLTIEAYKAAMQTQWSWILQLCYCVEQHLKENTVYFEFFNDAKESMDYLKSLQDSISRKYSCDRTSGLHRLEDLIQESMDEKEQLLQYRSTVAGLVGRAKSIVQLKPRNPEYPIRTSIPVKAICDYRQIEITIYKEDECVLASNSHRAKWKVISPSGNEAMVPSVCFSVPAPNKEAVDMASRIEQLYQNVLALWHRSHINMKSVVSWHYLMMDIRTIRKSTVASIKTMLPGEHQQVLSSLQSHFEEFLEDSEESEVFTVADCAQLEREVLASKEYYEELLKSAEREEHEESVYNLFISEVRNFRMRVEAHEEQLIRHIRTPLDRDDLQASMQRINEQERKKAELDRLKEDLEVLKEKCEVFLRQAANSPSVPTLSSELSVLTQSMAQVYSMCSIYLEKLKAVSLVVKHSQSAEALVKLYEAKLCEEDAVNADIKSIDAVMSTLKQWRSEIDDRREVFHDLEDELQKARVISDRMFKTHNERDFDLDWHKEKAEQLGERWRNVHSQIENRLRDLEGISKSLRYYKDTYSSLDEWSKEMEANQLKTQENQPEDSKALAELLNQQKVLVAEIERKQSKIDECQKYSEQYSAGVKDYELQLMTYRAMVDSQHKSPVKRRRMQSSSDAIQQEFMDLRTRYTALVTLMTQYVKFASETLKRAEEDERRSSMERTEYRSWMESMELQKSSNEEEISRLRRQKSVEEEKKEHACKVNKLLNWMSDMKTSQNKDGKALADDKASTESSNKQQVPVEEVLTKKEQIAEAMRSTQQILAKHSDKMTEEEKRETKEQLKSLHQAYSELSQQTGEQAPSAEQEFQVIEGILNVRSGAILSVCRSVQNGLIDQSTGLSLLEAQLITSELILPEFRMCLDLEDAFKHNLVDGPMYEQLQDLNGANRSIQEASYASEPLPVVAAVNEGAISERLAIKIIEIQLATGGLRVTYTGECLSLERAFQFGLIPHSFYVKILERQNSWKDLIDPNTAEKVSLIQLMQRSIVHEETGLRLLPVKSGKDGTISLTSGREISILRAVHEGLIDRETMIRLLSAQLFAGGIVDPKTNRKLTVEEALSEGLIDQDTASGILSHQSKNGGIVNPHNGARLTVDEAVQCDLMSSRSALLVLERQKCFMGLLWPHSGEILTVSTSVQHEIITDKLASELLCHRHKIAALYIPENSEVVDIDSATRNGLIDTYTKELLKTLEIPDTFPDVDNLNDRFSTWLVMREVQLEGSQSTSDEMEVGERSISAHSSSEFKQLFISYLMMNSYMDPKSEPVRKAIIDPEGNRIRNVSDAHHLGMLDDEKAENMQQERDQKLDLHGEQFSEERPSAENDVKKLEEPTCVPIDRTQMVSNLSSSLKTVSNTPFKTFAPAGIDPGKETVIDHIVHTQDSQDCQNLDLEADRNSMLFGNVTQKEAEKGGVSYIALHKVPLDRDSEAAVNLMVSPVQSNSGMSCSSESDICSGERFSLLNLSQFSESQQMARTSTSDIYSTQLKTLLSGNEDVNTIKDHQPYLSSCATSSQLAEQRASGKKSQDEQHLDLNVLPHSQNGQTNPSQCPITENSMSAKEPEHESKSDEAKSSEVLKQFQSSHVEIVDHKEHRKDSTTNVETSKLMDISQVFSRDITPVMPPLTLLPDVTLSNTEIGDTSNLQQFVEHPTQSYFQAPDEAEPAAIESKMPKLDSSSAITNRYETTVSQNVSDKIVESASDPAYDMGVQRSKSAELQPDSVLPNSSDKTRLYFNTSQNTDGVEPCSGDAKPSKAQDLRKVPPKSDDRSYFSEAASENEIQRTQTEALDSIVHLIQHATQGGSSESVLQGLVESNDPDLLQDLKKHEGMNTESGCGDGHEQRLPVLKQSQLLEVIQGISECKDPAVLKALLGNLSGLLASTSKSGDGTCSESTEMEATAMRELCKDDVFESVLSQQPFETSSPIPENMEEDPVTPRRYSTQNYLECIGKLQDHHDALEDIRNDLLTQSPLTTDLEGLHGQLQEAQSLETQLAAFPGILTPDMGIAELLLNSADELTPTQIHQDLAAVFVDLQNTFSDVCQLSAERSNAILQAIDAAKTKLESTYQDFLSRLDKLSACIEDNYEMVCKLDIMNTDDLETVKYRIQQNKDLEKNLSGTRQHLEDTAFDVQYFISEHAQFLSPAQNRQLLKSLSATQRAFKELMDRVFTQRHTLDLHLEIREDESLQQTAGEKQKEFVAKLQEMCDDLTQTENRLIGHQQQAVLAKSVGDLQQYQQEHQALQKDIQANASALNEVISSTKKFLEENRSKLTPEQITAIEVQLEEAKSKANMLNQRAEESRKDLEKVMTTAIKQETEKVAAVEQLEESKNKIEGLLDWISNIGKEKEMEGMQKDQVSKQNGNMAVDTQGKRLIGHNDDPNGNELDSTDNSPEWSGESEDSRELDLNQQYEKVKSHHQEILSQQQDLIIATQSAQALLDKQAGVLSPAEKEKLQRDIQELRSRYEASLTRAEQQIKQLQSIQEELRKFQGDSAEFESWLQHAQEQVEELGAPAGQLEVLQEKLQKQKSFYEDVISHKGDLRFITISGQKVLDVAKTCSQGESGDKEALPEVDTSGTCATVKEKLDSATARYKALHTQCNQLGTNLKDVVDKYKKYEDATGGLLTWLNNSEEEARRQLSEPIAADPQTLQRQLEDTKALQGQTTGHQTAVEMLRKIADALIAVEGDLLTNQDEIQEAVDDIVERYDNLSKSVSDRNEKLQVTLTRSLSVQDGLDEMMNWMEKVEESLEKEAHVPLDSDTIADALSKEAALEQDISSRQSSISTMKAKVKKFAETAEPAAAALLQTKMEGLSQRFTDACEKHKKKVSQMEELKEKVEQFEKTSEKVQQFVLKRSQALCETDGPGKNVNELSQLVQDTNEELAEHVKDMETLQMLSKELSSSGLEGSKALIQGKMANLSNTFNAFRDTIKEKEEEVLSCQDQLGDFKAAAGVLMKWLEETKEQVPAVQPNCSEQSLGKDLHKVNGLLEEWTAKAPAVQDINSKGSALCSLISVLTSPAKAKMHHKSVTNGSGPGGHAYLTSKELMLVQQNMSCVSEGYRNLGDLLKGRSSELNALLQKVRGAHDEAESMLQWLEDMKKTAASWSSEPTVKDSVKTQMEQQKAYEENMKRKQQQYQELREKVLHLIEENPDSPEAAKWKHMLDQIDAGWKEVVGSVENRKQHLEESSRVLELFQTTQTQLSQWLQEKELMMSVLGPLSMDPNMLNTQKQQVQILLKEFEGRKPQYEQLNEAAVAITSTSGKQDPAVEKVKEKVVAITQKWQGLTGQLSQRDALIEQAVGKTTQYQELLRRLGESAAVLESQLSGQQALSTQPDAVKKQLEDTNAILSQLCEEKKRLKEAERLCSELSNLVTEEYLKANLTKQLESVSKPFKLLEDKAGKRIRQLNSAFASSQQFHQMSKNFKDWLDQKLQEQAEPQSISAKVETLSENLKEHSAVQRALSEHEESYSTIMKEGEALLQSTEGAEKVALQGQLSVLKSNWEEVKRSAAEREEKLNTVMERAQKYKEHAENLSSWLKECDERQNKVKFSVNPVEVDNSLSQVKAIQKDVDKHRGQMELLSTASDSLLEVATEDVDAVKEEKAVIGKNLDKLAEDLQLKKESLDKLSQRLREFSDTHKELKSQLEGSKKQLESHSSLGVQAYSNKNLTNMKAQQTSLEAVQTQVDHLKSVAQSLVVDVPDTEGVTDLLLQADSLEKEHSSISKAVEDACSTLEDKLQGIGQFQNTIREMFTSFADFDDELDSMAPVGRDLETLRHQQGAIQSFISKLQDLMTNTASARDKCKKMLESEASPDLLGLKRDLEALSKQSGKLMDRANGRKEQVEDTLKHLEEFYSKLQTFTQKMTGAEEQEESQGPVGMETDVINQQLETFKVFQKEAIESLQTQLQDLNWLGQGLIQNAPKGTSTKSLEHDLEEVNTRWNTLNKKVAERSAQLHEALLHCGRFQDALESLLSWLTDTEELVASQKPPSAEFKVVKAQIQEQRLLQRLLDDRRPTVELIKKEGGKVTELADTADKEKIGREIECLGQRWDTLLKKAENRRKQLESILVVAQQFHETLEPLVEWLTATEKCLASSEPIGTQTSKLEEQIRQHKALEEEIIGRSKSLYQAMSLGQVLRTVSCMDDKELVQAKLDSTQSNYIELQERCRRKAELLQQALANAQLFGEDEVALMNWLDEVHCRLSDVSVQDYAPDVLDKQHAEQLALHEDIELRRQNVDQAMQNGLELLKQTTGDEVVVIQGKLDGIKTRYAEISTMSNSVLTTLNKALSLATKMQHTHEELSCWLEKVESELATFRAQESVGEQLTHVQERQKALMKEVQEHKPVVDTLNEVSSALLELVPWRAREGLDKLVTEDNERYRSASDAIAQHVDQTGAAILKSQQFEQAADTELAWLTEAERKLSSLGDIKLEPEQTTAQLQAQKGFSMDIMRHKDAVDDIVKTGEAILSSKDEAEKQALKAKVQSLLEKYNAVSQLNSERCLQLERAHSLACQFWETYEELWPWLQETQASFTQLPQPAIEYETLRQQQEELRQLRELIAEHKPHIDKMNKTGPQLVELSPVEGEPIRETYQATDKLYTQLKADVKHRAAALDEAISKSTQFHDKIDPMLESLERIAERLRQPPSISVEVEKIREQIAENKAVNMDLEKLQPSYETLKQRGEEMITRSEGADKDLSAKAVQDKLDQMVFVWNDIQALLEEREAKLLDVMDLAEKFWCDHCALIVTIKDTQDLLKELEEPGVDPSVVKQQQESVEGYREEIDGLQEELNVVQNLGAELMTACGEPDKPVIKKSLDEVNMAWETLNKTWKERVEQLEEAMQAAVQFQDGLQGMFDWVDILESKLDSMSPVGTDLETVKQQIEELKEFKGEAYQLQIEMERLNHQAGLLLKKVLEEADRITIQEPINELKMLWDNLDEKVINRQHKLEGALLALGQFQHALDELLAWLTHTEDLLSEQKKTSGDPKAIEIELAKHHVLQNDVLAHKSTVEAVNKAGSDLMESSEGEEACGLQTKLENLNQRWRGILEKTEQRRQLLDSALLQAQGFHGEIEDMQQWLKDTERQLLASKAVGGLPDTAREQLNAHLELCSAMEAKEELYQQLLQRGQQLIALTPEGQDSTTEQDLHNLQEKWECVQAKVAERKGKLEEALAMATDFHNSLQDFINWLTQAEQTLTMVSPASLILETILFQIDEHKVFVTEVNSHRDQIIELDKTGTHLKYFSQKQDVVLIKNLLLSVQSRWEKVVQRSVERGRLLDDARKRAKQFHESWTKLMEWLEESERALDSELEIANDPDKIKMQLAQHKEFQKALGGKHSVYDTTSRTGRALKDKTSLQDDNQKLDDMLCELRDKWDTVCGKSVERQNKLEEALLFSGQFTDALQALIDWLYKVEPQLAEDQPVHGDIDLVLNLIDSHKVFQKELGKRTGSVQALKRSARELIENSHDDSSWVKVQMQELSTRWETVCALSVSKQTRLEQALCQAEEFHSTVHILLEWLAEAEQSLRFHGSLPDDEEALRSLIEQHKEFMRKLEEKRVALGKATSMGEAILAICHPDSITTVKHWNTIIKARFEEVTAWARQHQQRLATALSELLATQELLESLLSWLQWAETTLTENDKEVLPQEIEEVKALIAEHQIFMEEMTRKQPDVDKVTKTHKRKATADPPVQSQIPVLDKGRTGRKRSPTQSVYPTAAQAQIETKNPRVNLLVSKWQQVWLLALDRRRKLNDALDRLEELKEFANFDFDVWRKRYMRWMNHKKSRVMDFFRRIDKDQDGKVTRQEFIEGILSSKFPTSRLEMSAVADIFDRDGDGYIDYYEFVAALHPNKDAYKPLTDADKIEDEVTRQVAKCKCPKRFQVEQIGANKYRFYLGNQFGDSQQLRLVRILRSTVMVRVGGGWMALDEFLVKNDPCRVHHHGSKMLRSESNSSITQSPIGWQLSHFLSLLHPSAKGRTNVELREKFILPEGTTQVMASFRYRGRRSRPSSRGASPNRSNSSHSCPAQPNPAAPGASKTPHLTRNYDKPWLTNSKSATPLKSSDSFESQGSSNESTPIQGSKLRLPGYLSGKGFQSGEEGTLINAAVLKAKGQAIGPSKNPSRPGSKAGSRGSSRRGSDASDFDISDIQSVCSDMSETVTDSGRPTPRSASRQRGGKPSKIPTPQRRSTPTSKLAKTTKR